jgi:hypothetical protein
VWIDLPAKDGFAISPAALEARVAKDNIGALLISNPCNPTGVMIEGDALAAWVGMARRRGTMLLMDEFYSHYHFRGVGVPASGPVSAAAHIEDVNADPVVIIDGLTKCYRYPGWRVGWVVASKHVIQTLTAAGSFLDGGSSRPIQRAAIEVLQPARADQETDAVRTEFAIKQKITVTRLQELGITFNGPLASTSSITLSRAGVPPACTPCTSPTGTFYAWGNIENLPAPIDTGEGFMREAFKHRVLTVPGEYFDVNPHRSRTGRSPLAGFVRFSFGPPRPNLEAGLDRLADMVRTVRG